MDEKTHDIVGREKVTELRIDVDDVTVRPAELSRTRSREPFLFGSMYDDVHRKSARPDG